MQSFQRFGLDDLGDIGVKTENAACTVHRRPSSGRVWRRRLNPHYSLTFPGGGQRYHRQRFARLPWRLALTFARFLLSSLLRFLAVFHSVTMPKSFRYFQNIFTIKLISVKYQYGITAFAIFRSSWRGAAFRTCGRAAPCGSTRALPPDPRFGSDTTSGS
jgi:hypothetical protein